jgi:flagellar basal-body rod modification protein FlgD
MTVQPTSPFSTFAASTAPGASSTTPSSSSASSLGGPAPTESMFLQLLVAQLKYQDPTSPSDPTQFVGELAQFSQLEQTIGINQNTASISQDLTPPATPPATTPAP